MEISDACGRLLAGLLEARTGQKLMMDRRCRIESALASLMRQREFASLDDLIAAIFDGHDLALSDQVVDALLNNETSFFRDRAAFALLFGAALDRLASTKAGDKSLSIWCAGCSTGQEAYSIAMHFAEDEARWHGWRISILGTDVSGTAIGQARAGLYSQFEVQRGLPVAQMMRWFKQCDTGWRIAAALRRAVIFQVRNLLNPPPSPGRFDIILCRNVLLYLCAQKKRALFDRLAEASGPETLLLLGAGETVIGQTDKFVTDPRHRGLYLRPAGAEMVRAVG